MKHEFVYSNKINAAYAERDVQREKKEKDKAKILINNNLLVEEIIDFFKKNDIALNDLQFEIPEKNNETKILTINSISKNLETVYSLNGKVMEDNPYAFVIFKRIGLIKYDQNNNPVINEFKTDQILWERMMEINRSKIPTNLN